MGGSLDPCCGGLRESLGLVSRGCPWGCPPWGPVPWSLALGAVAVPSSSSGSCVVALVAAGVVVWRCGRGGAPRGGVPCGFLCGCSSFPQCRCAVHPPCGFWWLVGVRWCDPYGVRLLLRRYVLGVCVPGSRAAYARGGAALVPLSWYALPVCGLWRLPWCPLPLCLGPRSCPFLVLGWFPAPTLCRFRCPVPMGACPSLGAPPCPLA